MNRVGHLQNIKVTKGSSDNIVTSNRRVSTILEHAYECALLSVIVNKNLFWFFLWSLLYSDPINPIAIKEHSTGAICPVIIPCLLSDICVSPTYCLYKGNIFWACLRNKVSHTIFCLVKWTLCMLLWTLYTFPLHFAAAILASLLCLI